MAASRLLRLGLPLLAGLACAGPGLGAGFDLCVRPPMPACVNAAATYAQPLLLDACEREVNATISATAAYRACLLRDMEQSLLKTNVWLDRFRCRKAGRKGCR